VMYGSPLHRRIVSEGKFIFSLGRRMEL
jgi:hypothetical protein